MKKRNAVLSFVVAAVLAVGTPLMSAFALQAPKVSEAKLPSPLPLPYDETSDAHAAVDAAIAKAKADGKYVLIDFGGNWCPDCRVLAGAMALKDVKPAVDKTFDVVTVDVGRFNKNLDIPAKYGVKITAVPTVIILDPAGHFMNAGTPTALSDARSMTPQAIVDTVFGWVGPAK